MTPRTGLDCGVMAEVLRLRWQEKACYNCRYVRQIDQGPENPCMPWSCALLGRLMSMITEDDMMSRVCDGWKRAPKSWKPYWYRVKFDQPDPYLCVGSAERLRRRVYAAAAK